MNPVQAWLQRACQEFSNPDEMREVVKKMPESNTKRLLWNAANRWGASLVARKHDKHWSR